MAKLNEEHIDEINEMIMSGMTNIEIASVLGVHRHTVADFIKKNNDKIKTPKKFPEYNLTKELENERKRLVKTYTRKYYNQLMEEELGPDEFEIESMLDECSYLSACSWDSNKDASFSTYCINMFRWRYLNYKRYLDSVGMY